MDWGDLDEEEELPSIEKSDDESVALTPPPPELSSEDESYLNKEDEDNSDRSGEMTVNLVTEIVIDDDEEVEVMRSREEEIEIDEACMHAEEASVKGGGDRVLREERGWSTPGIVGPWKVHRIIYAKKKIILNV